MSSIRTMTEDDLERVAEVFVEGFELAEPNPPEHTANMRLSEPGGCFVCEVQGEVVGYLFSHRAGRVAYLGHLAVDKKHRGRGIGKALVRTAMEYLEPRCDVLGLALDPKNSINLTLYAACGFVPDRSSAVFCRTLPERSESPRPAGVFDATQLGAKVGRAIEAIAGYANAVVPGLDLSTDLEFFVERYPDRVWFAMDGEQAIGVLAYHPDFRGDPWGIMRSGAGDGDWFLKLLAKAESCAVGPYFWVQFSANFERFADLLTGRGYRCVGYHSAMILPASQPHWPRSSKTLFLRPWWT